FMRIFCMLREPRGENGGNQKFNNCQMLKSDAPRGKIGNNQKFNISQNQEQNAAFQNKKAASA
ncbi:MAG: hypothetical protein ACI4AL_06555, partial [Aristaeellaceae bacterium]